MLFMRFCCWVFFSLRFEPNFCFHTFYVAYASRCCCCCGDFLRILRVSCSLA